MAKFRFNEVDDIYGLSQYYKKLEIHPVKMLYINHFNYAVECLLIRKNRIRDPKILKMSYLEYLLHRMFILDDKDLQIRFEGLLEMVLKLETAWSYSLEKGDVWIKIGDVTIRPNHFEQLKKIILRQNCISFDENLSEEMEEAIEKVDKFNRKLYGDPPTLREIIVSYRVALKVSYADIKDDTIAQFYEGLERFNILEDVRIYTYPRLKSGDNKIKSWMRHLPKSEDYGDYFTDPGNTIAKL